MPYGDVLVERVRLARRDDMVAAVGLVLEDMNMNMARPTGVQ